MPKKSTREEELLRESEEFILKMLKPMLSMDIELIQDERNEVDEHTKKPRMALDDPRRDTLSLQLKDFSVPFSVPKRVIAELKTFFAEKGWDLIGVTSSPSIKLKRIQPTQ
jgi:hypothetical protein